VVDDALTIRPAVKADLDELLALIHRAYRGDVARAGWTHEADLLGGQRTDVETLSNALGDPRVMLLVAQETDAMIGCVQVTDKGDGAAYLGLLTVEPSRQAGGLGRQLLSAAEQIAAKPFGAERVEMTVIRQRTELIAYYERRGYRRTGEERPFPHGDPRFGLPRRRDLVFVVLEKPISRS
jgi:ribosomal protein S18 acetylase RimI-like enzyme